ARSTATAGAWRRRESRPARTSRGTRGLRPSAGTRRRRRTGAPPSCSRSAWRTGPARSVPPSRRTARGRRTAPAGCSALRGILPSSCAGRRRRPARLELVHIAVRSLVEMAQQDLLVVEREGADGRARLEHALGGFERVAVLERVCLERDAGKLLCQAFATVLRRREVARPFEDVCVVGRRPVVVRDHPVLFPNEQHEVREEEERVEAPRPMAGWVERGGKLVEA